MDDMTPAQRRKNMQNIKSSDTKAEIVLRKILWKNGFRYRKNWKALPGKPDIVITKYRLCIFVDGEFFHGKNWEQEQRYRVEKGERSAYWIKKIERNIQRDREIDAELKGHDWLVLRFWSRDILKDPEKCVKIIKEYVFDFEKRE